MRCSGLLLVCIACMAGCRAEEPPAKTWWINSFKVPCIGVAPMSCLQVHESESPHGEWQVLYQGIDGFDYQPGNLYRVSVRVIELPPEQVPADASTLRYELVEIVEQVADPRAPLHDIFVLEEIGGKSADRGGTGVAQATLEFNVVEERYSGYDGCIDFEGPIVALDGERLELGPAALSDDECPQTFAASDLLAALTGVTAWRRDGMRLELFDETGKKRVGLSKVD